MNLEEFKADLLGRFPWRPDMNYMTADANGAIWQYANYSAPYRSGEWTNSKGRAIFVGEVEIPNDVDWRDSVIYRAETEQPAPPTFEQRHDALMAKLDELIGVMRAVVEAVQPAQDGSSPAQESAALAEFKAELVRRFTWKADVNYMAVDRNGDVYQYEIEPIVSIDQWHNAGGIAKRLCRVTIPAGVDWRNTLIVRAQNVTDEQ